MSKRLVLKKMELRQLTPSELDSAVGGKSSAYSQGVEIGLSDSVPVQPVPNTSSAPAPTIFYSGSTIGYLRSAAGS